ncbi:MAG TPA: endonuclease III [Acidobacteriota bacterium]|nr:endonuclease III [Acidobacteriota bacterium]
MKKTARLPAEKRIGEILKRLKKEYPQAKCSLHYTNAFELLIATILSAQCTDERVNHVTKTLFQKYKKPEDYVRVSDLELQNDIRTTGFFRNKTKSIQGASKKIIDEFGGKVPQTMEELLTLPGVARKTANVVLGNAFHVSSGVVVDTHVSRVSQRLALTQHQAPEKIERDLIHLVPKKDWVKFGHMMIWHGRYICRAIKPDCPNCIVNDLCPSSTV